MTMRHIYRTCCGLFCALLIFAITPAQALDLNADQKKTVETLATYLNELSTLESGFSQISSNGAYADGQVFLSRPEQKMRLIYNPPVQNEIIVRNGTIIYHDLEYQQVSYYPLAATPLNVLLKEKVDFQTDVDVVRLYEGQGVIELTLQDREDPAMGQVMLVFENKPLNLRKWAVTDAQGIVTSVNLINPIHGGVLGAEKFEFVDPDYEQGNR